MGALFKLTCLMLVLSIVYGRRSSFFDDFFSGLETEDAADDWFPSFMFPFNSMNEEIGKNFHKMSAEHSNKTDKIRKELADAEPNCKTTPLNFKDMPTSSSSPSLNRRKRLRGTKRTVCIREKTIDGTKYIQTEDKITDDKGTVISESTNVLSSSGNGGETMTFSSSNHHDK